MFYATLYQQMMSRTAKCIQQINLRTFKIFLSLTVFFRIGKGMDLILVQISFYCIFLSFFLRNANEVPFWRIFFVITAVAEYIKSFIKSLLFKLTSLDNDICYLCGINEHLTHIIASSNWIRSI